MLRDLTAAGQRPQAFQQSIYLGNDPFLNQLPALPEAAGPALRRLLRDPVAGASLILLVVLTLCAVLAAVLAPYDLNEINPFNTLKSPSSAHWLGSDENGRDVLSRRGTSLPADHPLAAASLLVLGKGLVEQGHPREAEAPLREALAVRRSRLPVGHWQTASAESALGRCLARQGRFREAEPLVVGAYERLLSDRGPRHERTTDALANVVDLYQRWNKPALAAEYRARRTAGS